MKLLVDDYEDELARLAQSALEIKILIAFLTGGGLRWLPDDKAPLAEFIVGVDLGITSPEALKDLMAKGASVRVFNEPGRMFHPKVIYMRAADGEVLIVGSNNLTSSGIASNHEVSVSIPRTATTDGAFGDFLAHFNWLKVHSGCRTPDDAFFANYKQSGVRRDLQTRLDTQEPLPATIPASIIVDQVNGLGEFLRLLAQEYPALERRSGNTVKDHPLKVLNDNDFLPLFKDIASRVSGGRLTGESQLTIGGNWYRIPNITAARESLDHSWEYAASRGRVILQVHFSEDYTRVFLSVVLQYWLPRTAASADMPPAVGQRVAKLLDHVRNASPTATLDLPVFRHWEYKEWFLWGKPILTFEYPVAALPSDDVLLRDLEFLATCVNSASSIT
jgi:hypothetical protein